jgi:hypothetical protein
MENFNMKNTFFFINQTSLFFPKLMYKQENIPVGDSISMCISISWSKTERGLNYDIMKPITGFPSCESASNGKFIWNSEDPDTGIDVPVWKQSSFEIDCTEESDCNKYCLSYNSIFVQGNNVKRCYSYEILENICMVIEYDSVTEDYKYSGGCYKDNKNYILAPAKADHIFEFDAIEIEVRNKKDPIIKAGELSGSTFRFGQSAVNNNFKFRTSFQIF